jgi:arsenate reductase (thioredoxin)
MAAGWTHELHGARIEALSAGMRPQGVDPLAVRVMMEAGVRIDQQRSKHVDEVAAGGRVDVVVTVCDAAAEACPMFPGAARVIRRAFDDPPALARRGASEAEALGHYRRVRDEIRSFIEQLPELLCNAEGELS